MKSTYCEYILEKILSTSEDKFINQIRAPGGHMQITIMIDTQQQYIKLNIRGEISIIVMNKFFMTIYQIYTQILLNCRTPP
jgi:hypothetical protein